MKKAAVYRNLVYLLCFFSLAIVGSAFAQDTQTEVSSEFSAAAAYKKNCSSCHDHGVMGAPQPGHQRFSKNIDQLVTNAINGIGRMPARGHTVFLSDTEIRSIVEYMARAQK